MSAPEPVTTPGFAEAEARVLQSIEAHETPTAADHALRTFLDRAARTMTDVREVIGTVQHSCGGCGGILPIGHPKIAVTVGGKRTKFTLYFHAACMPHECGAVPKPNPLTAWKAAQRLIADARRPEDVPAWVWERFAPLPF